MCLSFFDIPSGTQSKQLSNVKINQILNKRANLTPIYPSKLNYTKFQLEYQKMKDTSFQYFFARIPNLQSDFQISHFEILTLYRGMKAKNFLATFQQHFSSFLATFQHFVTQGFPLNFWVLKSFQHDFSTFFLLKTLFFAKKLLKYNLPIEIFAKKLVAKKLVAKNLYAQTFFAKKCFAKNLLIKDFFAKKFYAKKFLAKIFLAIFQQFLFQQGSNLKLFSIFGLLAVFVLAIFDQY